MFIKTIPGYAVFFTFLALISFVFGNPMGIAFLFFAFISLRYRYDGKMTYHCDKVPPCIALSCVIFLVGGLLLASLNINISLLAPVPVAVGITWLLHIGGKYKENNKRIEAQNKEVEQLKYELDNKKKI